MSSDDRRDGERDFERNGRYGYDHNRFINSRDYADAFIEARRLEDRRRERREEEDREERILQQREREREVDEEQDGES